MYNLYDVYDMGKLIMQGVPNKEVAEHFGRMIIVSQYAKGNKLYLGRYRFTVAGEPLIKPEGHTKVKNKTELCAEWDQIKDITDKVKSGEYRIVEKNGIKYAAVR